MQIDKWKKNPLEKVSQEKCMIHKNSLLSYMDFVLRLTYFFQNRAGNLLK